MKILIVSGFLGAGKTTFIKEMLKKSGKYLVILENEYGQNNIDSREISKNGPSDLQLLEFMEGCVCCTKKDSFANTLLTISAGIDPDYLVVEPTGVGMLSNIIRAIDQISYEKIVLLKPIVVLTPSSYNRNMTEFGDIYRDQIKYAGRIVFSKTENEDPSVLTSVSDMIHEINPEAEILQNHYTTADQDWWDSLFLTEDDEPHTAKVSPEAVSSDMMEISLQNAYMDSIGELTVFLEDLLHYEYGLVARAKGVMRVGGEWIRFDLADQMYAITGEDMEAPETQCVFIGRALSKARLSTRLHSYDDVMNSFQKPENSRLPKKWDGRQRTNISK